MLELLYYLTENQKKQFFEHFMRTKKKDTVQAIPAQQSLCFSHLDWTAMLRQTTNVDRTAIEFLKTNVHMNLEHLLTIQTGEFSSKTLVKNDDWEMKKKSIQKETEWFEFRLKLANRIRKLRESNLNDIHYNAKKQCLDQLRKYDETIRTLYANKMTLLRDRDNLEKDCAAVQNKLFQQLALYDQLKEERELNATNAFLAKVEYFRLNHAAKIIQRNWRLYCTRVSSKKKKSRK